MKMCRSDCPGLATYFLNAKLGSPGCLLHPHPNAIFSPRILYFPFIKPRLENMKGTDVKEGSAIRARIPPVTGYILPCHHLQGVLIM